MLNAQIVLRNNRRLQTAMRSSRLPDKTACQLAAFAHHLVEAAGGQRRPGCQRLGEARPFAPDVRVWTKTFGSCSWVSVYVTGTAMACFFFLTDNDRKLVEGIRERFPGEPCLRFQGTSLMDLVGHDWPAVE